MANRKHRPYSPYRHYINLGIIVVAVVIGMIFLAGKTLNLYTWWLGMGVATWIMYTFDKIQSKGNGRSRIPEKVLLGMAVLGGWGGGLIATLIYPRHKSQHGYFIVIPIVAMILHLAIAVIAVKVFGLSRPL